MIYLDSAATSLLKPPAVARAMSEAVRTCASPGRGSHRAAMLAAEKALECREAAAELFHVPDPAQIVFTLNATHALNIAIRSAVGPGERVVVSGYEHNAVTRPLHAVGARLDVAASPLFDRAAAVRAFAEKIPGAAAVVCTHVSNVFGFILPVEDIARLCGRAGVPFILDASQSAGILPLDFEALDCAFAAMPGHKGLMGPQGTGLLLCRDGAEPVLFGGTGSQSALQDMPDFLPDRLEAGTHNIPGIAGLLEGLRYVRRETPARIDRHERGLLARLADRLAEIPGVRLFRAPDAADQAGVLSVIPSGLDCEAAAEALGDAGVAVRSGLHCAPFAHRSAGTEATGTVRFSLSPFNRPVEMERAASVAKNIFGISYKM